MNAQSHHIIEEELIKGCLKGNPIYQRELYQRYYRKMNAVCYRYLFDTEIAEDLLQDAFVNVFQKLSSFRNQGSLEGWIRKITLNTIFAYLRKKKVNFEPLDAYQNPQVIFQDIDDTISEQEILNMLHDLPEGCRVVFNLFAIEGYSHKEIANQLNIGVGTSKSQLQYARKILQEKIKLQYAI